MRELNVSCLAFSYGAVAAIHDFFFFQAEDDIRYPLVTGVQTCALPISEVADAVIRLTMSYMVMPTDPPQMVARRSEERRVGKECRSRWSACYLIKKNKSHANPPSQPERPTTPQGTHCFGPNH